MDNRKLCQNVEKTDGKVKARLRRIPLATRNFWTRKKMIKKLVIPIISFPGAWTQPTKAIMQSWSSSIENALIGKPLRGRSRYLLWTAALGHDVCPMFALDKECLRHEIWRIRRQNQRQLDNVVPVRRRFAGRWAAVACKWGWRRILDEDGSYNTPDGVVQLGGDGKPAFNAAARRGWESDLWRADKRTFENLPEALGANSRPSVKTHAR